MNIPYEILGHIFSYIESPTNRIMKEYATFLGRKRFGFDDENDSFFIKWKYYLEFSTEPIIPRPMNSQRATFILRKLVIQGFREWYCMDDVVSLVPSIVRSSEPRFNDILSDRGILFEDETGIEYDPDFDNIDRDDTTGDPYFPHTLVNGKLVWIANGRRVWG